jgi:predicted DNA-binding transcriptional regulator YafY
MARSQRLLELIQVLRRHRQPVSGQALADELSVSLRTVYRDIQTLIGQGATIDGEAGLGFVLRPGFVLPPLMFSDEELEALVLGLRWVAQRTDASFEHAAMTALAKIAAVLPDDLRNNVEGIGLIAVPSRDADGRARLRRRQRRAYPPHGMADRARVF